MPLHERLDRAPRRVGEAWGVGLVAGFRWVSGSLRVGTSGARGRSLGRRCATQPPSTNSRNGCRASLSGPPSQQRPAAGRSRQGPMSCRALGRSQRFAVSPRSLFGAEFATRALSRREHQRSGLKPGSSSAPALKSHFRPLERRAQVARVKVTVPHPFLLRRAARNAARRGAEATGVGGYRR